MDLSNAKHLTASGCFVCGHAGKALVIWPQQPIDVPTYIGDTDGTNWTKPGEGTWSTGKWSIYLTSHDDEIRSGKKRIDVCLDHYNEMGRNWIAIAQSDVDLEEQWHNYISKVEQ